MSGTATKAMGEVDLWGLGRPVKGQTYRGQVADLPTDIS